MLWLKLEIVSYFMLVLVTCIRESDQILTENEVALPGTAFPLLKSMGNFFIAQGLVHATLKRMI